MSFKNVLLYLFFIAANCIKVYGQADEFCNAINTITQDAPNKFRDVRGNATESNMNAMVWACEIKIPGTINSRFVASQGFFYEGALYQSKSNDGLQTVYDKYKEQLRSCLAAQGYKMSSAPNFTPGLEGFKKVVFIKDTREDVKPEDAPAHITMEALYSKEVGLYTIVFYIFEH